MRDCKICNPLFRVTVLLWKLLLFIRRVGVGQQSCNNLFGMEMDISNMAHVQLRVEKVNVGYLKEHFDDIISSLYPERRERVLGFRREEPKYVSMVAGLMLQELVQSKLGINPCKLVLERNANGKPYVAGHPDFYFNISHAGEYVVLAYSEEPVGVDIERIREQNERVAKRCFTESENQFIFNRETGDISEEKSNDINSRFYQLWTMKEAYLKLTGQGISVPLNSFEIDPEKQMVIGTDYRFESKRIEDYWLSVCTKIGE